jgi:hypothetical protein
MKSIMKDIIVKNLFPDIIKIFVLIILVLILSGVSKNSIYSQSRYKTNDNGSDWIEPIILWNFSASGSDSIDQVSFHNAFNDIGFSPLHLSLEEFNNSELNKNMLIIVPGASSPSLSQKDADNIMRAVQKGARVITDGGGKLINLLKITLSRPARVKIIKDHVYSNSLLNWADAPSVPLFLNTSDKSFRELYTDSITGHPLGILKKSGSGMILLLSTLFDPISGKGYSRFPNLTNLVINEMHCIPLFKRRGVDAYFDPGYRYDIPVKKLVSIWSKWGIRAIHTAAWNMYDSPSYDYNLLINEAHKKGILVYAWLEWPYIGERFWNEHQDWRQKNALLKDAKLDFLFLMDLQNPECMTGALNDLKKLLRDDWDGIDIAEFSITGGVSDALAGPNSPKDFTGFNDETRKEFISLSGFDQVELFNKSSDHYWKKDSVGLDKFYKYRVLVNNRLLRYIVSSLDSVRTNDKRDWEFIFTVLDNSLHPEFDQLLGFDLASTIKLAQEFHSTLQVEDPASEWTRPPDRYQELANAYSGILGNTPFAIDINIVPVHPPTQKGFASGQPTGTELFRLYKISDIACGRVCFYSESTIYPNDWTILPFAMASDASIIEENNSWKIKSPHTVILRNFINKEQILLDGKPWECYDSNNIIIPNGEHNLTVVESQKKITNSENSLHLVGISDELINCFQTVKGIEIEYRSPARCIMTFNKIPGKIQLDGNSTSIKTMEADDNFILIVPSGRHKLQLETRR